MTPCGRAHLTLSRFLVGNATIAVGMRFGFAIVVLRLGHIGSPF